MINENINYENQIKIIKNYGITFDKIVHTRKYFLKNENIFKKVSQNKIVNRNLLHTTVKYNHHRQFVDSAWLYYFVFEILQLKPDKPLKLRYTKHRFFPIARLFIMTKIYYLFFVFYHNPDQLSI